MKRNHSSVHAPSPARIVQCDICGHLHRATFDGDCRDRKNRFTPDMLDEQYGKNGWEVINARH